MEFCLIQGQRLVAQIDRLTQKRTKTSEAINQNPHRAIAEATFITSISARKMSPISRKRFSHHGVKTSTKILSLWIFSPNKFLNPELAEEEWWEQYFIVITMTLVALVMTCDFFHPYSLVWRMGNSTDLDLGDPKDSVQDTKGHWWVLAIMRRMVVVTIIKEKTVSKAIWVLANMQGNSLTKFWVLKNTYLWVLLLGNYTFPYCKRTIDDYFDILVSDWSERIMIRINQFIYRTWSYKPIETIL